MLLDLCSGGGDYAWQQQESFVFELESMTTTAESVTVTEGDSILLSSQHLIIHQLPEIFKQRYGKIPGKSGLKRVIAHH